MNNEQLKPKQLLEKLQRRANNLATKLKDLFKGSSKIEAVPESSAEKSHEAEIADRLEKVLINGGSDSAFGGGDRMVLHTENLQHLDVENLIQEYIVIMYDTETGELTRPSQDEAWPDKAYSLIRTYSLKISIAEEGGTNTYYHVFTHNPPGSRYNDLSAAQFHREILNSFGADQPTDEENISDDEAAHFDEYFQQSDPFSPINEGRSPIAHERLFPDEFREQSYSLVGEFVEQGSYSKGDLVIRAGIREFNKRHEPPAVVLADLMEALAKE